MALPPIGPFSKKQDPTVCIGEAKACGLCANCTYPAAARYTPRVVNAIAGEQPRDDALRPSRGLHG